MKQSTFKSLSKYLVIVVLVFVFISCSVGENDNLVGAWKFVSGEYSLPDTTMTLKANAYLKAVKIFSQSHYSNMTQDLTKDLFISHGGTYDLVGDQYIENKEISINVNSIGQSAKFKYKIDGNKLILSSETMNEIWEKIE